jgi:hypothetical protein
MIDWTITFRVVSPILTSCRRKWILIELYVGFPDKFWMSARFLEIQGSALVAIIRFGSRCTGRC